MRRNFSNFPLKSVGVLRSLNFNSPFFRALLIFYHFVNKTGQCFLRISLKASSIRLLKYGYITSTYKLINQEIKAKELTLISQLLCTTRSIGDDYILKKSIPFCCDRIESDTCLAPQPPQTDCQMQRRNKFTFRQGHCACSKTLSQAPRS